MDEPNDKFADKAKRRKHTRARIATKRITATSLFIALVAVATISIAIPAPAGGFFNLGDAAIFLTAACLGPWSALAAGGIGSMLGDIILGYLAYSPFTLVIKGLEGFLTAVLLKLFEKLFFKKARGYALQVAAGAIAMLLGALEMACLYTIADLILYGPGGAIANAPFNLLQGVLGAVIALVITYAFNLPKHAARFGLYTGIKIRREPKAAAEKNDKIAPQP